MESKKLMRSDLIYPELSYKIVGILFEVYNQIGAGLHEKYYQKLLLLAFKKEIYYSKNKCTPP